jgi:hypothetical protein
MNASISEWNDEALPGSSERKKYRVFRCQRAYRRGLLCGYLGRLHADLTTYGYGAILYMLLYLFHLPLKPRPALQLVVWLSSGRVPVENRALFNPSPNQSA